MQEIIQLKISLAYSKPPIWRRVLITKATTFFELHHIIQIVMGWGNYHLYEFNVANYRIGQIQEDDGFGFEDDDIVDSTTVNVGELFTEPKDTVNYMYDFGDGWKHQIKAEKFHDIDATLQYPICIGGKMNCAPEDCGGIGAFYEYIDLLDDKNILNHDEMTLWFKERYEANAFDIEEVNETLKDLDNYIRDWISGQ